MTDTQDDCTPPITVKATVAPVVMSESTKLIGTAACAVVADHCLHSDLAIGAVVAASGAILCAVWGLWSRIKTWGALKKLANLVDDSVAVVGKH